MLEPLQKVRRAGYDVANPATEVANPGSQTYATLVQYTLDGLGNRSQVATTPGGGTTTTVTYATDVVNQYTTVGGWRVATTRTATLPTTGRGCSGTITPTA